MLWLYNFGITLYSLLLRIVSPFNPKAKLFLSGRKNIYITIEKQIDSSKKHIWFHFASLGEFEQGRPVLERLKEKEADKKIIVTFFSPSGYEIRKNYPLADGIFYLPLDTKENAEKLISLFNPEIAVFTKYEFWYHYFEVLHQNNIPLFIISSIFRPKQLFFKWYGGFYRGILKNVTHFFVQNEQSVSLLKSLQLDNVSLSGDTRFDRVAENVKSPKALDLIRNFCGISPVFIAGSTWPEDEHLLKTLIDHYPDWKFIIAPHEINKAHINQILKLIPDLVRYTELQHGQTEEENSKESDAPGTSNKEANDYSSTNYNGTSINFNSRVLLIDNIGMLSSIYQYAKIAYIGGGFGAGIHNTLEAAAFGLPVIFGPKYEKFQEAKDLIELGAAVSISSENDLSAAFEKLQKDLNAGILAAEYVNNKTGSTKQIVAMLENYI